MSVIAADIGGTHSRFVVVDVESDGVRFLLSETYASGHALSLDAQLNEFVATARQNGLSPRRACLAVAGPVTGDNTRQTARITNLDWTADTATLTQHTGLNRVSLLNDFEAVGYGLALLNAQDVHMLRGKWAAQRGHRVVIGAGTGLGVCQVLDHFSGLMVVPTESGHVDFSPRNELQVKLWRKLKDQSGHLAYDRVVSGPGIAEIFRFMVEEQGERASLPEIQQILAADDVAAAVTNRRYEVALARDAVTLFLDIYAHVAGNFALMNLCRGGVYLAGGIAPRLIGELSSGSFLETMASKGPMSYLFDNMPVGVITNTGVGLLGAAYVASLEQA